MKKIIIIGGGAAGAKAAAKAKRENKSNIVELYTKDSEVSCSLCGLPYYIEGSVRDINDLIIRRPQDFVNNGIQVFLNHEATQIFPEQNSILISNNHIFYDELILALGANVSVPEIINIDAKNIFTLRSLDDGVNIRRKMQQSKTVVVVGAGLIAIELIEAFLTNGLNVIVVEAKDRFVSDFDRDFSEIIGKEILKKAQSRIQTYFSTTIVRFKVDEQNTFKGAVLSNGEEIFADFCVLSTGIKPNIELAQKSGIKIGSTGAINVDNKMRTNYDNIFAAGDCAQKYCIITKQSTYIGLGSIANKEGRIAAINASSTGKLEVFDGILNSVVTRFFDCSISRVGLTKEYADTLQEKINIVPVEVVITKKDKAGYMPNSNNITLKLVADKRSGELLGAQAIGELSSTLKRINTIASSLKSKMTVDGLLHLDLPYAPPFSSSIDPIITAAYKLKDLLNK